MGSVVEHATVLLIDLDNTLYDWLGFFGPAIRGLCSRLSELSGCSVKELYDDFRLVFSRHGTVEYSFALQELPCLLKLHPDLKRAEIVKKYFSAIEVYQSRRRQFLKIYRDVPQGLQTLRDAGIKVIAVSDAHRFHIANRLKQLRINNLLDGVCYVADREEVDLEEVGEIRRFSPEQYRVEVNQEFILPEGLRKPSPIVLDWLLERIAVHREEVVYAGDSLLKDIPMAKEAGVYDCWTAYGAEYSPVDMATLIRLTNWPPTIVSSVLNCTPENVGIIPSYTARSFFDVVKLVLTPITERPIPKKRYHIPQQLPLFELSAESAVNSVYGE